MKNKLLYVKVYEEIIEEIISGKLKSGDKVRSVREMSMDMKVNPKTIQKAFKYLDDNEIFISKTGEGRYVTENEEVLKATKEYFIKREVDEFLMKMDKFNVSLEEVLKLMEGNDYE